MAVNKAELLDAIATGGTAAKKAYEDAQAAVSGGQAEAIRMALSSGIAGNAPAGYQDQLSATTAAPYQSRNAALASQQAASSDWFARMGASAGQWGDVMSGLQEAVLARALAEASGGGGGSGGGGSGGGEDPYDWYSAVTDKFGTGDIAKGAIGQEALGSVGDMSWNEVGLAPYQLKGAYLEDVYGAPAGTGASWYPQPKDEQQFEAAIPERVSYVKGIKNPARRTKAARKEIRSARGQAKKLPGNQKYLTSQVKSQQKKIIKRAK